LEESTAKIRGFPHCCPPIEFGTIAGITVRYQRPYFG
jgi:hypothetical protein